MYILTVGLRYLILEKRGGGERKGKGGERMVDGREKEGRGGE